MKKRLEALRTRLAERGLDGILVSQAENRRYLSGFTGSSGVLLVTPSQAFIITDGRYVEQAAREAAGFELHRQTRHPYEAVGSLLGSLSLDRIGFEPEAVSVAEFERWKAEAPSGLEWVPLEGIVSALRVRKDEHELDAIRAAQEVADAAFPRLLTAIQPGKTEKQVAWELEQTLRGLGADGPAFPIIVASGPNSALPHYRPGERVIQHDEIVLVDYGARLNGYNSDCTRTFFTGDPSIDDEFVRVYNLCLEALHRAEAELRAGLGGRDADSIARGVIGAAGQGDDFAHSLGHGIGLAVHEGPSLSQRASDDETVPPQSVITIEPGIYKAGWGGVRIEDLAIVHEDGIEVLTRAGKAIDAWLQANAG